MRLRSAPGAKGIGPDGTSAAAAARCRASPVADRPRGRSQLYQALLDRLEHRLAAGMNLELAVDVLDMPGHGLARQAEMAGDLGVAETLGDAPEDVDLARCQLGGVERGARRRLRRVLGPAHNEARDRGRDRRMPGDEIAYRGGDIGWKRILEQIAGGADGNRRDYAFLVAEDRD